MEVSLSLNFWGRFEFSPGRLVTDGLMKVSFCTARQRRMRVSRLLLRVPHLKIGLERKLCKCLVRGSVSTALPMLGFSYLNAATNHRNHVVVEIGNRELF